MTERLHYTPRPYQRIGTQFLLDNQRCNLWAKPGMGKTGMVLSLLDIMKIAGSNFFPALVVAPKRVADIVWPDELAKWDAFEGISLTKILGNRAQRADALLGQPTDLSVINYENLLSLREHLGGKWPFKTVIADESKRLAGFQLQASTKRADMLADIAQHTGRWINLTGTPATRDLRDLWGQNWFVDFGARLGHSKTKFESRWFQTNPYSRKVKPLPGAEAEIHAAMADVALAFRPEDWFEFEKPRNTRVMVRLPREARRIYDEMDDKLFTTVDGVAIEAPNGGVRSMKCLQIASGSIYPAVDAAALPIHDAKVEALESVVSELNEPLLVAYYFAFTPARILKAFPKARVLRTKKDINDWNAGRIDLMLVHYQSAGHGLNLQDGGRAVLNFDQVWDEELRQQVVERVGPARQAQSGYKRIVLTYDLVAEGTEDEAVMIQSELKCSMQEALFLARSRRS